MSNDASTIKSKDVETTKSGQYSTTDNISILNVVCLSIIPNTNDQLIMFYTINYSSKSNTTNIICYYRSSYVSNNDLGAFNLNPGTIVYAYQNRIDFSISIRLYYI